MAQIKYLLVNPNGHTLFGEFKSIQDAEKALEIYADSYAKSIGFYLRSGNCYLNRLQIISHSKIVPMTV